MVLLTGKVKFCLIKKLATGIPPPSPRAFFPEFPLISVISGKLFGAHGQGLRMVGAEERDFYFYTKRILALSKLYFERLPAMSWTWLQISGDPVFKTLGRYVSSFSASALTPCCLWDSGFIRLLLAFRTQ